MLVFIHGFLPITAGASRTKITLSKYSKLLVYSKNGSTEQKHDRTLLHRNIRKNILVDRLTLKFLSGDKLHSSHELVKNL